MNNLYYTPSLSDQQNKYKSMMTSRERTSGEQISQLMMTTRERPTAEQTSQYFNQSCEQLPKLKDRTLHINPTQQKSPPIQRTKSNLRITHKKEMVVQDPILKPQEIKEIRVQDPRLQIIDQFINLLEEQQANTNIVTPTNSEIQKILLMLGELSGTLFDASRNEIQLNKANSSLKSLNLDFSNLKQQFTKQKNSLQLNIEELTDLKKKNQLNQIEYRNLEHRLQSESFQKEESNKRVRNLEERLEFAVKKNLNAHREQLHNTLGQLIKECEDLKREKIVLNKEIERQRELMGKINSRNRTLIKKLEGLKTKQINLDDKDDEIQEQQKTENILDVNQIPQNLEFRYWGIQPDYLSLILWQILGIITDVIDHGTEAFALQIVNSEDKLQKRDLSSLISQQFLSYLEFSERLNVLLPKLIGLFALPSVEQVMSYISREFKNVFKAEQISLWLMEEQTGYLFSYDLDAHLNKVLYEKGAFSDVFQNKKIQNRAKEDDILMYQSLSKNGKDVYGSRFILIPVLNNSKKVCGILEISKIYDEKTISDEQYLGVILVKFTKQIVQKIINSLIFEKTIKYKEIGYVEFVTLCNQQTRFQFLECVQGFCEKMFSTSKCSFLFYNSEKNIFLAYKKNGSSYEIDGNIGIAGQIASSQKIFISQSITKEINFHSRIDIETLSPVYFQPVLARINSFNTRKTIAVLQFVVKTRRRPAVMDHDYSIGDSAINSIDIMDSDAQLFAQLVSTAYTLCENQLKF